MDRIVSEESAIINVKVQTQLYKSRKLGVDKPKSMDFCGFAPEKITKTIITGWGITFIIGVSSMF